MSTLIDEQRPTARVVHQCGGCGRTIHPGERYLRQRIVDVGDAWTWKECAHCEAVRPALFPDSWDETLPVASEVLGEYRNETVAHRVLWRALCQGWRRADTSELVDPGEVRRVAARAANLGG